MLPTTLVWLSTTASEVRPSLFISFKASLRGLSPLGEDVSIYTRVIYADLATYLIDINCWDPMPRSVIFCGYSSSIIGKHCPFSHRNLTSRSWLKIPMTLSVPSSTITIRWVPPPNVSIAWVRFAVRDKVTNGSLLPKLLTSFKGITWPCCAFLASFWKIGKCSSSGKSWPVANKRY